MRKSTADVHQCQNRRRTAGASMKAINEGETWDGNAAPRRTQRFRCRLGCIGMSLWRPRLGDLFLEAGRDAKKESPVQRLLPPRLLPGERPRHHERLDSLGYFYEDEAQSGLSFLGLKRR
jgi:hypothetical protein